MRRGMSGKGHRSEYSAARAKIGTDSQGEHNLVGQMSPNRHTRCQILFGLAERSMATSSAFTPLRPKQLHTSVIFSASSSINTTLPGP